MAKSTAVVLPNLGLRFDRPPIALGPRELQDGLNFRVKEGKLSNLNIGYARWGTFTLNGPVKLIDRFLTRASGEFLIFATTTDLYKYVDANTVVFITPNYNTGTAAASGTTVTGTGTSWSTAGIKAGDFISFGNANQNSPSATWYKVQTVNSNTQLTLTTSAGTIADGPYNIRRVFTMEPRNRWSTEVFIDAQPMNTDLWIATNGTDNVVTWNGTDTFAKYESSLGITGVTVIRKFANQLLYFNFVQGGERLHADMINSNVGEPLNITSGLSEQFRIHADVEGIVQALPLGDSLVIYSPRTFSLAQFVGDPLVYVFRLVGDGLGPIAGGLVANFADYHTFIGADSKYYFDGVTVDEEDTHVFREVTRRRDPARTQLGFHFFDEEQGDLIWALPLASDAGAGDATQGPEFAYVEHYLEAKSPGMENEIAPFSRRQFPFTCGGYFTRDSGLTWNQITETWADLNFRWVDNFFAAEFPINLVGTEDGKIFELSASQSADGAALTSYVRFGRRAVADGRMRGLVSRIYPFVSQFSSTLDVTLRMADHASGPATITDTQPFNCSLPEGAHFTSHYRRGRFMDVQFGSTGTNAPWEITGYDAEIKPGGSR